MSDHWRTLTGELAHLEDPDRVGLTLCGRPIKRIHGGAGVGDRQVRAPDDARVCSRCSDRLERPLSAKVE